MVKTQNIGSKGQKSFQEKSTIVKNQSVFNFLGVIVLFLSKFHFVFLAQVSIYWAKVLPFFDQIFFEVIIPKFLFFSKFKIL